MSFTITDSNEYKSAETIEKAAVIASEWYDYMLDDSFVELNEAINFSKLKRAIKSFHCYEYTLEGVNEAIAEMENEIAKACGYEQFVGHGNYSVNPASAMGLQLVIKKDS